MNGDAVTGKVRGWEGRLRSKGGEERGDEMRKMSMRDKRRGWEGKASEWVESEGEVRWDGGGGYRPASVVKQ